MESGSCGAYPAGAGLFDELPWMPMPPAYYAYPVTANGQQGYPMAMQHSLSYPNMAGWYGYNTSGVMQSNGKYKKKRNLFTKLQLNMLQRRFAEKEHIRQPERDNFAHMIGLTGEQVKIWFQNQRYKRKHRDGGSRNVGVSGSTGANTSVSSLSSPSPVDSPNSEHSKLHSIREGSTIHQANATAPNSDLTFQQTQNYSQLYWGSQVAYYPTPPIFSSQNYTASDEKLSSSSENDLNL